jgi:hypothetical protein
MAARVGARRVARELQEVEGVGDGQGAREIGDKDDARFQRRDEQRLAAVVVARNVAPELRDARP